MHEDKSQRQDESLLRMKLFMPTPRPDLVRRQRLVDTLHSDLQHDDQFNRRLTLISAPAGYGKTTLACQWLLETGFPVAWLTLEPSENDPTRFLAYLVAAFQTVSAQLGREVEAMLRAPQQPPQDVVLTALLNELSRYQGLLIVVLDDYHTIQSVPNHEVVNYLVEHLPDNIHLVITSREDPPLPLHRLQARRQMLSIRQADLSFLTDEVVSFFKHCSNIDLLPEQAERLTRRTEGWITGLQLAALSMRAVPDRDAFIHSFTGSNRYILDYLFEEVFNKQPQEVKAFLLQTSILDRICAELADAITGKPGSQAVLEDLEQSNFFIVPLDQSRHWYRYHRLFVDLLRHRLDHASYHKPDLHELAAGWYADHGFFEEAIEHALAGQHWIMACDQIESASNQLLGKGELTTLLRWYRQVPEQILLGRPDWALSYAWPLILIGESQDAYRILEHIKQMEIPSDHFLHGHIAAAEAFLSRSMGDMEKTIELSKHALALIPEDDTDSRGQISVNLGLITWHLGRLDEAQAALEDALSYARVIDNDYLHHTALLFLARTSACRGDLEQAAHFLNLAHDLAERLPTAVLASCDQAELSYLHDDLEHAWENLEKAKVIAQAIGNQEFQCACFIQEALFHLGEHRAEQGLSSLEPALAIARADPFPPLTLARIRACQVQLTIAQGELEQARQIYTSIPMPHDAGTFTRFIDLNKARLLLAEGERDQAMGYLHQISEQAERMGWGLGQHMLLILMAVAERDRERALGHLETALETGAAQGIIRTFVAQADELTPLLKEAAGRGIKPEFVRRILNAIDGASAAQSLPEGLIEPLSERELEVLRLVAAGLSNRQIAEHLVVSLGTAKSHLHHIFGKLEVSNRTEASAKAQEMGLL